MDPTSKEKAHRIVSQYLGPDDEIDGQVGWGTDGIVYSTTRESAIKYFWRDASFGYELEVYLRLRECDVSSVCGHVIPTLLGWNDRHRFIEISYVQPPFVLDFAKCRLDFPIDFPDEALALEEERLQELFDDHWPVAERIRSELRRRWGIYYYDMKLDNIKFAAGE